MARYYVCSPQNEPLISSISQFIEKQLHQLTSSSMQDHDLDDSLVKEANEDASLNKCDKL